MLQERGSVMRLVDADELYSQFIDGTEGYDCNTWNRIEIGDIIEDTPTVDINELLGDKMCEGVACKECPFFGLDEQGICAMGTRIEKFQEALEKAE